MTGCVVAATPSGMWVGREEANGVFWLVAELPFAFAFA